MREEILTSIARLDSWVERNGWAGYDPFDVKGHPVILKLRSKLKRSSSGKMQGRVSSETSGRFLSLLRKLLNVKKQCNAKAMALFASAYIDLHQATQEQSYLQKATQCIDWLKQNRNKEYSEYCWGYPFDWWTLILIPKGTPSAVVSSICGNAFWDFYRFTGDKKYLDVCESVCVFLTDSLNIDHVNADEICFSYTPIDRFHVHNANLFAAELLIKVGKELNQAEFYQHGIKALNYTLEAQNEDGSFYYWALSDKETYGISDAALKSIDHYHTGFVLRSLYSIYENTREQRVLEALSRGYRFYKENLFEDEAIPKLRPDSTYPVDIHSCSEAILCMSTLSELFPDAHEFAWNAFLWTKNNMQGKDGHFYYRLTKERLDKTPFIRWGQAWMMRALANLVSASI